MRGPGIGLTKALDKPYDEDRLREIRKEASRLKKEGLADEANHMSLIADAYENGTSMGKVSAALIGVADGLTMNYGDEIAAGTYALARMAFAGENLQKTYGETASKLRRYQKEAEMTEPYAKGIGEFGGAIATNLLPGATIGRAAGTAGRAAIETWKAAKGVDRLGKVIKAGHVFGKAAIPYGIISGTGRGEGVIDTIAEGIGGGVAAYGTAGVLGPLVGQFFRKGIEGDPGDYIGQKGKLLAKMRETFGDEVDKHVDEIDELNDNLTKYGLKGLDLLKGSEKISELKKAKNANLGTFLNTWNSEMRKMGDMGELNPDLTSVTGKELVRDFHKMVHLPKDKVGTGSPFKSKPDFPKIRDLVWGVNDNLDDGSVKTLSTAEARQRMSRDGETVAIDKLDRKEFNVAGLRRLLNIIDEKVNFNDPDQNLFKKFGAHIRAEYGDKLGLAKSRIDTFHPEAKAQLKDILPNVEGLPGEIHTLKKLEDLYLKGINNAKTEAADEASSTAGAIGRALRFGTKSKVRQTADIADKILSKKKGTGILEIDLAPDSALKPSGWGYRNTGMDRTTSLSGRTGDIARKVIAPDIEPPKIDLTEELRRKAEEDAIKKKQLYNDERTLETIPTYQHGPGPMDDDERGELPLPQTSIEKPKTDKLLAAIRRARNNGEIISTTDPDFKKKIRKYLVDSDLDYV